MSDICTELHRLVHGGRRFSYPFNPLGIPKNGIYVLFEKGEVGHGGDRIVRMGTHTGEGQLPSRLQQHFSLSNKDRSIFRKQIGRCLLIGDPYANVWEIDFTTRQAKENSSHLRDIKKEQVLEDKITAHLQESQSFVVLDVPDKSLRLTLESRLISTVSRCINCSPSADWLGLQSPILKICQSGLWQVNELYKEPLQPGELLQIAEALVV